MLLVEHKSLGRDLDRAHTQARDYFHGLTDAERVAFLFQRYQAPTSLLPARKSKPARKRHLKEIQS